MNNVSLKYTVKPTTKFSRDLKRIEKRGYKIELLTEVIKQLAAGKKLNKKPFYSTSVIALMIFSTELLSNLEKANHFLPRSLSEAPR